MEPASSWKLVGFITAEPWRELCGNSLGQSESRLYDSQPKKLKKPFILIIWFYRRNSGGLTKVPEEEAICRPRTTSSPILPQGLFSNLHFPQIPEQLPFTLNKWMGLNGLLLPKTIETARQKNLSIFCQGFLQLPFAHSPLLKPKGGPWLCWASILTWAITVVNCWSFCSAEAFPHSRKLQLVSVMF